MAGASNPAAVPFPFGPLTIKVGGFVPNGKGDNTTPATLYKWIAPFDCYVRKVTEFLVHGSAGLDLITIRTIDTTKKTIVAQVADPGTTNVDGVVQTLHSDIVNFKVVQGNGIEVAVDSSQSNESGILEFQIDLEPAYAKVASNS